ncbi:Protein SYS1 [Ceratocystis platani]|uniref:Protein SYS1 n=1 Tax=Ceratocystis fimbriata f. sp. platani TaxID=88771 RepID=A0A0F8DBL1_CERFI|nr:Protein SYS1 [Ceratocystis platani]
MARRRARRPGAISELPPLRILTQLALLQALYYAVALVLTVFSSLVAGQPWKPALVFGWADVRGDVTTGWLLALLMVLDGGVVVGSAIVVLVGRSKLVPDFAISTQAIHLAVVYLFNGMPRNNMWWMATGCSAAVASFLGIIGSRSRELQPISFGGRSRNGNGAPPADEEAGEAGLPRLPAWDGAGDYEMVAMTQR